MCVCGTDTFDLRSGEGTCLTEGGARGDCAAYAYLMGAGEIFVKHSVAAVSLGWAVVVAAG